MHDVGADHHFWLKTVEQQKHHHDDAAGADGSDAHQKTGYQADERHPDERLHRGRLRRGPVFNFLLEEQEGRNANQQNSYSKGNEVVHSITISASQMRQKAYAQIRTWSAADNKSHDYFAPHCAFAQMDNAGADLGDKVEESVGAHG